MRGGGCILGEHMAGTRLTTQSAAAQIKEDLKKSSLAKVRSPPAPQPVQ